MNKKSKRLENLEKIELCLHNKQYHLMKDSISKLKNVSKEQRKIILKTIIKNALSLGISEEEIRKILFDD